MKSAIQRTSWFVILFGALSLLMTTSAFADTYNFYFSKKKPKASQSQDEEQTDQSPEETPGEESPQEESGDSAEATESEPAVRTRNAGHGGREPIVINNYNTNNLNSPQQPTAPAAESTIPETPAAAPSTESASTEVIVPPLKPVSPWRLGVSMMGNFSGITSSSSFPSSNDWATHEWDTHEWVSSGSSSSGGLLGTYGAMVSLAYVPSHFYAVNLYTGALKDPIKSESAKPYVGLDLELYPFASAPKWRLPIAEFGFLTGVSTFDGVHGRAHVGARLNINLNSKFGLTTLARVGKDVAVVEFGMLTRL